MSLANFDRQEKLPWAASLRSCAVKNKNKSGEKKMYDFESGVERRGTNCVKWDVPFVTEEVLPMWIADMDFRIAPAITESLQKTAGQGAFGYQFLSENYYSSVMNWMKHRHGYELKREEICFVPNVVMGLAYAVQTIAEPEDEIIVQTPAYGPFFEVVKDSGCIVKESRLKNDNGYYTMDLDDLESRITEKTKAVIICNPHNPSGRVWTEKELRDLADICIRHNLYILSDDIHSELLSKGSKHTFISMLSNEIKDRCFIFTSPSKAFNLAGIHVANCFISNEKLRTEFMAKTEKFHAGENTSFAEAALTAAYDQSEEWLKELNEYIDGNLEYFVNELHEHMPTLGVRKPEGTYLVWVDFRNTDIPEEKVRQCLLEQCKIAVNEGDFFGEDGIGFVRFNLACPRKTVEMAVERLKEKFAEK